MQATRQAAPGRVIRARSLTDDVIYDFADGGITSKGEPTQSRLRAEHAFKKRVLLEGSASESLPLFALAEVPSSFSPDDPFDRDVLKDRDGQWAMPTAKWKAEQKGRLAKRSDSTRIAEVKAKQNTATTIADNLARLVASQGAAPKTATQQPQAKV